jgi:SAM-dependent methyltransferase
MQAKTHWDQVYTTRPADQVSWFQPHAELSLRLIRAAGVPRHGAVIDVGGGASTLVDDLLAEGYVQPTVLDLSEAALQCARQRLGAAAGQVRWLQADITTAQLPHAVYDLWHDRAVFHFLTSPAERAAYVEQVLQAVKPGGHVIVATFADDGPERCSGLPVMRYSEAGLHDQFGAPFTLVDHRREAHHTPGGAVQQFVYCYCRKVGS